MSNFQKLPVFTEKFEEIYSNYFQRLYLYARKLLKSDHLAEDVVADVFYNLWKTQSDFSKIREIETYLFVAVKNQVVRMLSKDPNVFVRLDFKNELQQVEQSNPEEILLEKELVQMIDEEISKLPGQCQIIFKMARNEQKGYKDIADEMGISVDAVKSQIYKATNKIRDCVSRWKTSDTRSVSIIKDLACVSFLLTYPMLF